LLRHVAYRALFVIALAGCDAAPSSIDAQASAVSSRETACVAVANDVTSFGSDLDEAFARAKREQLPLLIFFEAGWCTYCRQLQNEVFGSPEFQAAAARFVCVQVDGDQNRDFAEAYRVRAYPTLVLAAPDGTAIERIVGYASLEMIVTRMTAALTAVVASRPASPTGPIVR
jgi:thioredoxin-related protein